VPCDAIAQTISKFLQRSPAAKTVNTSLEEVRISRGAVPPKLVVRLLGSRLTEAKEMLSMTPVIFIDELDNAATQAVTLTKKQDS
jgi:succinyl-CoA synthetase beta subunit